MDDLDTVALEIARCRTSPARLDGVRLSQAVPNEAAGYATQRRVSALLARSGFGPVAGYKIGMTNAALQSQFRITEPLYGAIHDGGKVHRGAALDRHKRTGRFGIECEVAITLSSDLPDGAPPDQRSLVAAIRSFHVAIEIVQDRFAAIGDTSPWVVIADTVLHHGFSVGDGVATLPAGDHVAGELWIDNERVAFGTSAMMLGGGPVQALTWFANKRARQGLGLRAGDVVLCGSIGPVHWLELEDGQPAREVRARLADIGEATIELR